MVEPYLSSVPSYMMSFLAKGVVTKIDFIGLDCFGKKMKDLRSTISLGGLMCVSQSTKVHGGYLI